MTQTSIQLSTPRSEQGQMIEHSYGWHEGSYYLRILDRSDGSAQWFVADDESAAALTETSYDAGGAIEPPDVHVWTSCREPQDS